MERALYMLQTDRPGIVVAKTHMQKLAKGISENILQSSSGFHALKGDIFEELPNEKQPSDETKIAAVSVEDETKVIEVDTTDLSKLNEVTANLLFPIKSSNDRYSIFFSRNILTRALDAKIGDKVKVNILGDSIDGIIEYKGKLKGKKGTYFGILLQRSGYGNSDGTLDGHKYFTARRNMGFFASIDMLKFSANPSNYAASNGKNKVLLQSNKRQPKLEKVDSEYNLIIGDRVVAFGTGKNKVLKGVIKFIGREKDNRVKFGIELDTPDGQGDGKYEHQQVFKCKPNHAVFADAENVIAEKNYPGMEDFEILSGKEDQKSDKKAFEMHKIDTSKIQSAPENENGGLKGSSMLLKESLPYLNKPYSSSSRTSKSAPRYPYKNDILTSTVSSGPRSLQFIDSHFSEKREDSDKPVTLLNDKGYAIQTHQQHQKSNFYDQMLDNRQGQPPSYEESLRNDQIYVGDNHTSGSHLTRSQFERGYDPNLQVDSVVEVNINNEPHYGVIRWKGVPDNFSTNEPIVGLELDQPYQFGTDGSFKGKRYFICPSMRGFFVKLSSCKRDSRFTPSLSSHVRPIGQQEVEKIAGIHLPVEKIEDMPIGQMRGIQGHHNSCYLDSTLFAMFAFSIVFDVILHREKRMHDIQEYDDVRKVLKETVVNPLRSKGYVNAGSVLQLRKWLDRLGSVQGFMNEEKDPEEFLMLLFRDVLKVDPFLRLRTENNTIEKTYLYQIWVEKDEFNPLPSLQYLVEQSFLTGNLRLEEIPSVFIVQLPRFGMQKIYKRIKLNAHLDVSKITSSAIYDCLICENKASVSCRDCCSSFGWNSPFVYLCDVCNRTVHGHSSRRCHNAKKLKEPNESLPPSHLNTLELFAIVCIKTSHYVTFAKCGIEPNEKWVFFDSMADRKGDQDGQNVPEVVECPEVSEWFNEKPLKFTESDVKNTPEKILRLFEDASLCFYRSNELSIYK
eukprot:gene18788-20679_t